MNEEPTPPADLEALAGTPTTRERAGGPEWRTTSRAIYQRLRGSQCDLEDFMRKVYPTSHNEIKVLRPGGYIDWVASQHAQLYPHEPRISYLDPTTHKPHDDKTTARIVALRARAGIREAFHQAHEEMVTAGNGVVWLWPVLRDREIHVIARALPAHLQAVAMGKHPETGDERDVAVWWFRHPIPGAQENGLSRHGLVRVDRTTARWQLAEGGLEGQAVWPSMGPRGADAMTPPDPTAHGLGEIPAIVFRWQPPESGDLWCHAREVLLAQARAWDLGWTEGGDIATMQGHGQMYGENMTDIQAGKLKISPRRILGIGAGQKLGMLSPNGQLMGYVGFQEAYMRVNVGAQNLSPQGLLRSTAITAQGKEFEVYDRDTIRGAHVRQFARGEQRAYDLLRRWYEVLGLEALPPAIVHVEYQTPEPPRNPRDDLQASAWRMAMGLSSPARELARLEKCSLEEARRRVAENKAETIAALGSLPAPAGVFGAPPAEGQPQSDGQPVAPEVTRDPD